MSEFGALAAGDIAVADWRDGRPKEANKRRPAVVVEGRCSPRPFRTIPVPLTEDAALVIPELTVPIEPTAENGCTKPHPRLDCDARPLVSQPSSWLTSVDRSRSPWAWHNEVLASFKKTAKIAKAEIEA